MCVENKMQEQAEKARQFVESLPDSVQEAAKAPYLMGDKLKITNVHGDSVEIEFVPWEPPATHSADAVALVRERGDLMENKVHSEGFPIGGEAADALIRRMTETIRDFPSHLTAPPETKDDVMREFLSDLRELLDDYEHRWKTAIED